jgi:cytosine/adenosine deaminase-related metal-dependent hydrolase
VQLAAHAPDTCSTDFLRDVRDASVRTGLRVQTHLSQSKVEVRRIQERDGLSPPELLDSIGLLNDRLVAAHCIHLSESDIARIGSARVFVAHIPKGNATGGTDAPTRRLVEAGARLTLATDNMHADMVEILRWALCMGRVQTGRVEDSWQPEHMLHAATEGGAAAMGMESEIGQIALGFRADCVAIDLRRPHLVPHNDPLGTLVHTGMGRDVTLATDNRHGDMVEAMRWGLCMGRIQTGRVEDSWQPEHMLHAATEAGAAAMGLGAELGRVAPGWLADLTIIHLGRPHLVPHNDPLGTLVHTGQGRDVSHVIVAGDVLVENGRPTRCDMAEVMREGAAAAAAVWARAS